MRREYFLSSMESEQFRQPRRCIFLRKLRFTTEKICFLAKLSPPVIGQRFGLGEDLEKFILASRHEGESLDPIESFPCFVFIARPLIPDVDSRCHISDEDVEVVAWGELYRTRKDAENHIFD